MEGVITGAWISPDRTKVTIQVDEDGLYQLEAGYWGLTSVDMVPVDWDALGVPVHNVPDTLWESL
jgi:hypothetical protein